MIQSRYPQLKEIAQVVISKAEKLRAIESNASDSVSFSDYQGIVQAIQILDKEHPIEEDIMNYLSDFPNKYIAALLTLMYVGRDHDCDSDFSSPEEEFDDVMEKIGANISDREASLYQMIGKGFHLAEYLNNGLKVLEMQ